MKKKFEFNINWYIKCNTFEEKNPPYNWREKICFSLSTIWKSHFSHFLVYPLHLYYCSEDQWSTIILMVDKMFIEWRINKNLNIFKELRTLLLLLTWAWVDNSVFFIKTSYKFILHSRGIHIPNASSKYSILSKSKTDIKSLSLVQINPVIVILNTLSLFTFSLCHAFIKFKVVIQRSRTKIILISTEEIILNPSRDFSI